MTEPLDAMAVAMAVDEIDAGSDRFADVVAGLSEEALRGPSLLPGWTRGHVATHVARNAEAYLNLLHTAATGEARQMYESVTARNEAIEAGAGRSADELMVDLQATAAEFSDAARSLPLDRWDQKVTLLSGRVVAANFMLPARMREVEFHHVDLAAGYLPAQWDPGLVRACLDEFVASTSGKGAVPNLTLRATDRPGEMWVVRGIGTPVAVSGPRAALLAWVSGRANGDELTAGHAALPELPPWP
jgi:maleylpyruvate isomerase